MSISLPHNVPLIGLYIISFVNLLIVWYDCIPSKVLDKVINVVTNLNINFVLVYELDIVKYEYPSNSYTFYLYEYMSLYRKKE